MRIALLSWESKHSIAVGGLGEHVSELALTLQRREHDVHLFTRVGEGQSTYDCIDGVHYHRCPYEPHSDFLIDNGRMCDSFLWHLREAEDHLGAPFDIVHGHDWLSVRAIAQAKNEHNRPVVMTMHSTEYGRCGNQLHEGPSRRIRALEWVGTYVAERVICVSGALRKEVQNLYSTPTDKTQVIYNGIDVRRFDARVDIRGTREQHGISAQDPLVLFAGRLTWQKGPDILMEALPGVLQQHPKAKFVFAGDGDLRQGLEKRAATLGVATATRFVGYRNGRELVGLFKSADIVCVPSRNEPFGIVILEAWSARKPVVATRNGGPAEFVKHHDTGLTVSDNRESIGWGLDAILANKSKGRRMGRNGRREAEARFSWDTIGAATERVYRSVLDGRSGKQAQPTARIEEIAGMARQTSDSASGGATRVRQTTRKTTKPTSKSATAAPKATRATIKTRKTTQKSKAVGTVALGTQPSIDDIRRRAHEIYLGRGDRPGTPESDWLQAEYELRELNTAKANSPRGTRRP